MSRCWLASSTVKTFIRVIMFIATTTYVLLARSEIRVQ
jgi:hypothetical protein